MTLAECLAETLPETLADAKREGVDLASFVCEAVSRASYYLSNPEPEVLKPLRQLKDFPSPADDGNLHGIAVMVRKDLHGWCSAWAEDERLSAFLHEAMGRHEGLRWHPSFRLQAEGLRAAVEGVLALRASLTKPQERRLQP